MTEQSTTDQPTVTIRRVEPRFPRIETNAEKEARQAHHDALIERVMRTPATVSRRAWERPARELLNLFNADRVAVDSPAAADLIRDLRAALDMFDLPDEYR